MDFSKITFFAIRKDAHHLLFLIFLEKARIRAISN